MNLSIQTDNRLLKRTFIAAAFVVFLLSVLSIAYAAPGAHGPNGEHLDTKNGAVNSASQPRMEAKSDLFELVATLYDSELSVLIDRYETNEPVLNAELEVESGGLKARAKFHADLGDYSVDDPAFLKALLTPGEHALVFTLVAGKESDLLDGTLVTAPASTGDHGHDHNIERTLWAGFAALIVVVLGTLWRLRRRKTAIAGKGMQS